MLDTRTRHEGIVGRTELLRRLLAARHHSRRTGLTCHVVTGEPKVGKTALLTLVCRHTTSRADPTVHIASSRHANRLLTALVDGLLRLAAGHHRAEVERAAARLRADVRPGDTHARKPAEDGVPGGFPDLVEALTREAPLVIALDDIDQATPAALVLLRRALRDIAHLPVMLIASTRRGEPAVAAAELANLLHGAGTITLRGLNERETGALMAERLRRRPDADIVATCHRITAGNPFMVIAVCDWIRAQDPLTILADELREAVIPAVADAMIGRASRVDPRARAMAEAIAVATVSGKADPALVARVSGCRLKDALETLDLLARMRLVTDDHAVSLRHPLLSTTLRGTMTVMSRNAAHLAAAAFLHRRRDAAPRVARHLAASTVPLDTPWSVTAMITAARSADTTASDRVRYLEQAAQAGAEGTWSRVAPELAAARIALDRREGMRAAAEMLGRTTDMALGRRLLGLVGATLCEGDRPDEERDVLEAVRSAVAGTEWHDWPQDFRAYSRPVSPTSAAVRADEGAGASPARGDVRGHPAALAVSACFSDLLDRAPSTALARAREALDHDLEDLLLQPPALPAALTVLIDGGHQAEAFARRHALVHDLGRLPRWVRVAVELVEAAGHYAAGELFAARFMLTERLSDLPMRGGHGYGRFRTRLVGLLANIHLDLGDPAAAETLLRRDHHEGRPPPEWYDADVPLARARLRVRAGDLAGGAEDLWEIVRHREAVGGSGPGTLHWRNEGVPLLAKTGSPDQAVRVARRQVKFAEGTGSPQERARAARVLGAVSQGPTAVRLLKSAVDQLREEGHDLETARAMAELGTVLARSGRAGEAVANLTRSARLAADRGARELADRVRLQLVALDARTPQDVSLRGILSLTPREREILIDAVSGQPNTAIAGNRHITRRTVELHLSSAYRKLGIAGRGEFGKILGRPGLWEILTDGTATSARRAKHLGGEP
ncbi:AAA family ATPase [Streptomyces johnsoniae]|uniref:AAA family ATPase n=1 Tax=Streptomyces johnsoniae TaxID=3075532 RepID=A0ABU2S0T8_9ACTN|nr:AAA family ATPase [Streptomyces sp. DSM 41886]MDT0441374.1 AAA family ATPase [Streptomyces sp. DSM 41886]